MLVSKDQGVARLTRQVREMLQSRAASVPFHGWPHTDFVRAKAVEYATMRGANTRLVEAAALVHDVNYLVAERSAPDVGADLRADLLRQCGFSAEETIRIEAIVREAHMAQRGRHVDPETASLSDADTLYKSLPITPVLYAHRYLDENGMNLSELAKKIVEEQRHKLDEDYYFYDAGLAARYRGWALANLQLWEAIQESLSDPDVARLVEIEGESSG